MARSGVTPYAALQVASLRLPSYAERATMGPGTFALSYAGRTDTQTRSGAGRAVRPCDPIRQRRSAAARPRGLGA